MSGGASALQGRIIVRTAPLTPIPPTAPELGATVLRVERLRYERHHIEKMIGGQFKKLPLHVTSTFVVNATLEAWAGDQWREAPARALLDALDVFHAIGTHGLLVLFNTVGLYRVGIVELDIPLLPTDPDVDVLSLDLAPSALKIIATAVTVPALVTSDGKYFEPAVALSRQSTAAAPYRFTEDDAKPLSAGLLARALSSAWRMSSTPDTLGAALPLLRATFKRYLLTFAKERLQSSRNLVARERLHWSDDQLWVQRLTELKILLDIAHKQFADLYLGIDAIRDTLLDEVRTQFPFDPLSGGDPWDPPIDLNGPERRQATEGIDKAVNRSRTTIDLARARFVIHASRNTAGAVGLIPREDVFDGNVEHDPIVIRENALERIDGLLATADQRLADIERELNIFSIESCPFYKDLLTTQPITDVALQLGFGMNVIFEDVMSQQQDWKPWAPMSADSQYAMQQELLAELLGQPVSMLDREVLLMVANIAIIVPAAIVGAITGQVWVPLLASAIALGVDIVDLYLKLDRIAERGQLVHTVHGLPGYRDPELVRDFWMTAVFTAFGVLLDVADAVKIARRLQGVVALDHRFSLIPGLRRSVRDLADRARVGFDEVAAAARANAIQAANAGLRFGNKIEAENWATNLFTKLNSPTTFNVGKADFLSQIDARGGWVAVEDSLTQLGAATAIAELHNARRLLINSALTGQAPVVAGQIIRAVTLEVSGDLLAKINALKTLRASFTTKIGAAWAHQLGLTAHLVLTNAADKAAAVQKLRSAWPANWTGAVPPANVDNALSEFAETLSEGFGGWAALGKQLDNALPEVTELRKLRDERLYPYLETTFNIRKGGTESIASDLDVSVMFEVGGGGVKKRMDDLRDFLVRATGLSDPQAWRNAFDMELFVDPSLATFYDRLQDSGSAFVLAQYVFQRSAALTNLMRLGGDEPLLGFDLLAQYARKNPFPDDLLAARIGANGAVNTARETETTLLSKLDEALTAYDDTLAEHALKLASKADVLDSSRRISDVALAVAMNNDEAYFLAGATKTVMSIRDGSNLYKGLNVSLKRLQRLHIEELHQTLDENWFAHVVHDVARVRNLTATEFAALGAPDQKMRLAQAFFQMGKYGQMRAVGFVVEYGAKLDFAPDLVARATQFAQRGAQLKAMRNAAEPRDILKALGKLDSAEIELLDVQRLLRDNPLWPGKLSDAHQAILDSGSLSAANTAARARQALDEELAVLVGNGLNISPPGGVFPAGSLLGDLQKSLRDAQAKPLLDMREWLAAKLAPKLGPALVDIGDSSLAPDPAAPIIAERVLGATPPADGSSLLDPADLAHLGLDPKWQAPQ